MRRGRGAGGSWWEEGQGAVGWRRDRGAGGRWGKVVGASRWWEEGWGAGAGGAGEQMVLVAACYAASATDAHGMQVACMGMGFMAHAAWVTLSSPKQPWPCACGSPKQPGTSLRHCIASLMLLPVQSSQQLHAVTAMFAAQASLMAREQPCAWVTRTLQCNIASSLTLPPARRHQQLSTCAQHRVRCPRSLMARGTGTLHQGECPPTPHRRGCPPSVAPLLPRAPRILLPVAHVPDDWMAACSRCVRRTSPTTQFGCL